MVLQVKPYPQATIMLLTTQAEMDVKAVRDKADMTQREIASEIGVGLSTWKRWEASGKFPKIDLATAEKLSSISGVPIGELPQ